MTHDTWNHHRRESDDTRHCKDDALDEAEFERFWRAAETIDGYRGVEARYIAIVGGRLGLRVGELAHLRRGWVDLVEQEIQIPAHQPCRSGRNGTICGSCTQKIKQTVNHNDVTRAEIEDKWWRPKTQAGARTVPWDWCSRAGLMFEEFFDEFDRFEHSPQAINRRVKTTAELADGIDPTDIYPHALRASAANYHARRGLGPYTLCSLMGWANLVTAQAYVSASDGNVQRAIRAIHSQ